MPRGRAKPKAVDTPYYTLDSPEDFTELLKDALKTGYQGAISAHTEPDGNQRWGIQLNSPTQQGFAAEGGEVVLWDTREFTTVTRDVFTERYSV